MFFSISTEKFDDRFFNHIKISNYYLSLDTGWNRTSIDNTEVFFKGYCDTSDMLDIVAEFLKDPIPKFNGNFGIIMVNNSKCTVTHDITRSFPLNIDNNGFLTNVSKKDSCVPVWADRYVTYKNKEIEFNFFNPYPKHNFENQLSLDECANKVKNILDSKIKFLVDCKYNIKHFLTGGLDTTLLYAMAKSHSIDFEILNCEHIDYDRFLLKNHANLKKEYAVYNQMHVYKDPTLLFCGAPGDEYFMRGPYVGGLWAAWQGIDIFKSFKQRKNCYHEKHFSKPSNVLCIKDFYQNQEKIKIQYQSYTELCMQILSINANDSQMWHINNTTMWTPFKDLDIVSTVLQLNRDDLLDQILDGKLSRRVISMYDVDSVELVDDFKNYKSFEKIITNQVFSKIFS